MSPHGPLIRWEPEGSPADRASYRCTLMLYEGNSWRSLKSSPDALTNLYLPVKIFVISCAVPLVDPACLVSKRPLRCSVRVACCRSFSLLRLFTRDTFQRDGEGVLHEVSQAKTQCRSKPEASVSIWKTPWLGIKAAHPLALHRAARGADFVGLHFLSCGAYRACHRRWRVRLAGHRPGRRTSGVECQRQPVLA